MTNIPICPNCFSRRVAVIDRADGVTRRLVTSDAQRIDQVVATRLVCSDCACVCIAYDPPGRLREYFAADYDIGDVVQDHPIVAAGSVVGKHTRLNAALRRGLPPDLPDSGTWLEIACGRGALSANFQSEHPGWECHALDPAADAGEAVHRADPRIHFVEDFFDLRHYRERTFDLIVAHGLLNRAPVWPQLVKMRRLAKEGTLLSLDLLVLERSVFAPHIWDHPFMYTLKAIECFLAAAGFAVRQVTDCVSSVHLMAECVRPAAETPPRPGGEVVARAHALLNDHAHWWKGVVASCHREIAAGGEVALYGAGLFSAVLLSLVSPTKFTAVIDETRAGGTLRNLPVIGLDEAAARGLRVLLCARSEYVATMGDNARAAGLSVSRLDTPAISVAVR